MTQTYQASKTVTVRQPFSEDQLNLFRQFEYDDPDARPQDNEYVRHLAWIDKVRQIYRRCGTGEFTIRDIDDIGSSGGFMVGLKRKDYITKVRRSSHGYYVWKLTKHGIQIAQDQIVTQKYSGVKGD